MILNHPEDNPYTYTLTLSEDETDQWADRPGNRWPCSTLAGHRLDVVVDRNGLCDLRIDGCDGDCDGHELEALIADHLPKHLQHLWPVWSA